MVPAILLWPAATGAAPPTTRPAPPPAGAPTTAPADIDGPAYTVTQFVLSYGRKHPSLPPIEVLMDLPITLGKTAAAFVAPRKGLEAVTLRLKDAPAQKVQRYHASAVNAICAGLVEHFNRRGLIGIFVAPHEEDIDERSMEDLRPRDRTALRVVIWTAVAGRVRTVASGQRVPTAERTDNPVHDKIRKDSPIQKGDLLQKDKLDDYIFWLNRQPGRRVDAAISSLKEPADVAVDLLVTENKPWMAYAQVSNTGTKTTSEWRQKFGFVSNQLTGSDDVLTLDYATGCFETTHAAVASYEAPVPGSRRLRWRAFGNWSQFDASEVGVTYLDFSGTDWSAGGQLIANVCQRRDLFIDVLVGLRCRHVTVKNKTLDITGREGFFLPSVGARLEKTSEKASTKVWLNLEGNCPTVGGTGAGEIIKLGRVYTDREWLALQWDIAQTCYLEPLLAPAKWKDPANRWATLAHELAVCFKGQYAFDYRLIPQAEDIVGGLYTVRGYPESAMAGDTALIATAEYRYHVPRAFKAEPNPGKTPLFGKPFRFAPQQPYGRADWDLIFRTFVDAGRVLNSDRVAGLERNETLIGAGVGVELQFTRNFNIRCDWGAALRDVGGPEPVSVGDNRFHVVATFLY